MQFFDIDEIMSIIFDQLEEDSDFTKNLKKNKIFESSKEYHKLTSKKRARNYSTEYLDYEQKKMRKEKCKKRTEVEPIKVNLKE